VLDFYSPSGYTSNTEVRLKVLGRLVRLDDGAVLWARTCVFDARVDRVRVFDLEPRVERVLTDVGLAAADRCARDLAESFLAGMPR
jgi:TolB-like protein